jgi:DNA-binding transcriptional ArsR family regulator
MSIIRDSASNGIDEESTAGLSDETCRQIVRILHERKSKISPRSLAVRLAASNSADPGARDAESVQIRLHHVHLPKLATSGLVELDETGRAISTTNHPLYERERVDEMVARHRSDERTLTSARHRQILEIVEAERGVVARESLARELAHWEADDQPTSELVENVETELHHQDLPKLVEGGLVEYDQDDGIVERRMMAEATPVVSESTSNY